MCLKFAFRFENPLVSFSLTLLISVELLGSNRVMFQLQVDPIRRKQIRDGFSRHVGKYTGVVQATRLIMREEGMSALWKGHLPGQYLSGVYGIVQVGIAVH